MPASPLLHHHLVGPPDAPPLLLGPSLGTSTMVWEPQLPVLIHRFRVLRFDLPGHGGSPANLLRDPGPGRTTVDDLASLVLDLVDHHGWERFHYAGISLGGAIGAYLATRHPNRVESLSLVCSSAHFGPPEPWHERADGTAQGNRTPTGDQSEPLVRHPDLRRHPVRPTTAGQPRRCRPGRLRGMLRRPRHPGPAPRSGRDRRTHPRSRRLPRHCHPTGTCPGTREQRSACLLEDHRLRTPGCRAAAGAAGSARGARGQGLRRGATRLAHPSRVTRSTISD